MIWLAIIFGVIMAVEWRYLKRNKRSQRAVRLVLGFVTLMFLFMEAAYMYQDRYSITMLVELIFSPMQKALFTGG